MYSSGLKRAFDLQADASGKGFDWPTAESMLDKLHEELDELRAALQPGASSTASSEELGDLLFVLVNLARKLKLDPEAVLQQASDKFERRFAHVLRELSRRGLKPEQAGLDVMEALWIEAKQIERQR